MTTPSKPELRKHFLALRNNIKESKAKEASLKAAEIFLDNINLENIRTIALYLPIKGEIDPTPLATSLKNKNISLCLPIVKAKNTELEFHSWKTGDKLVHNHIYPSLQEPELKTNPIIPDLIIVPLVAFDTSLTRLGYGGGFYDRTLIGLRSKGSGISITTSTSHPLAIGYGFEIQKSNTPLPADELDMKMDYIVTDKAFYP